MRGSSLSRASRSNRRTNQRSHTGTFPLSDPTLEEEERRLFYVAVTRAKTRLCLSYRRQVAVQGKWRDGIPSAYLRELPHGICSFLRQAGPKGGFEYATDAPDFLSSSHLGGGGGALLPSSPSSSPLQPAWRRDNRRKVAPPPVVVAGPGAPSASSLLPRSSTEAVMAAEEEAALKGTMRVMMEGGGRGFLKRSRARTQAKARAREATRLKRAIQEEDDAAQAGAKTDVWTLRCVGGVGRAGCGGGKLCWLSYVLTLLIHPIRPTDHHHSSVRALSSSLAASSSPSSSSSSSSPAATAAAAAGTAKEGGLIPSYIRSAVMTAALEDAGEQQEEAERESRIQDLRAKLTALEEEEKDLIAPPPRRRRPPPSPLPLPLAPSP